MKLSAVEWLYEELTNNFFDIKKSKEALKQANKMFEQQIIDAWHNGYNNQSPMIDEENCGQTYYNKTFKK